MGWRPEPECCRDDDETWRMPQQMNDGARGRRLHRAARLVRPWRTTRGTDRWSLGLPRQPARTSTRACVEPLTAPVYPTKRRHAESLMRSNLVRGIPALAEMCLSAPRGRLTRIGPPNIIPSVMSDGMRRRRTATLAVIGLLGLAVLPPEHVHVGAAHDGRHEAVIHRHFEAHHESVDGAIRLDDGDDEPIWPDAPFVVTSRTPAPSLTATPVLRGAGSIALASAGRWERHAAGSSPIHDPPLISFAGFRGPPASV